jgi:hypothetical protein
MALRFMRGRFLYLFTRERGDCLVDKIAMLLKTDGFFMWLSPHWSKKGNFLKTAKRV